MKILQQEFSKKEKAERLLTNLEELKSQNSIEESQYSTLKQKYSTAIQEARSAIEKRKSELKTKLAEIEKNVALYDQELKNLATKFKVGEFNADIYKKKERAVVERKSKLENEKKNLESWINAQSSANVGGFKEVDLEQKPKIKPIDLEKITEIGKGIAVGDAGTPQGHIQNAIDVITNPVEFFSKLSPVGGILEPLVFGAFVMLINVLGFFIFRLGGHFFGYIIIYYIMMVIGLFIFAIILMIVSKIVEGSPNFEDSFRIVAYSSVPMALGFIPYIGILLTLYSIYIMIIGIEKFHKLERGKAIAVGIITYLLSGLYVWLILKQVIFSAIVHTIHIKL